MGSDPQDGRMILISGLAIRSALDLPGEEAAAAAAPACEVRLVSSLPRPGALRTRIDEWPMPDGLPWLVTESCAEGTVLRFRDLAEFFISSDLSRVDCVPFPGIPGSTIQHLVMDQVIPRLLSRIYPLVLHAGAVETPAGAVLFLGPTGSGKSTLTAAFCRAGHRLIADDFVALRPGEAEVRAVPSYPGFRLHPDALLSLFGSAGESTEVAHYTPKRRVALRDEGGFVSASPVVVGAYLLESGPEERPRIIPVRMRESFLVLMENSFRLVHDDPELRAGEFRSLATVCGLVPVRRLCFRRDLDGLEGLIEAVLGDERAVPSYNPDRVAAPAGRRL